MILSEGKNNFKDNEFSYWEWSAPVLQNHEEVIAKIKELKLQGRIIKGFYVIGMGYDWTDYSVTDWLESAIERKKNARNLSSDGPIPFLPEDIVVPRAAMIDEPFLIEFEDGDILGIDYSEGSCVRMEMNTIPKNIGFGTNARTFHPDKLFEPLIGKEIIAIEVTTSTECDEFTGSHGLDIDEQDDYITKISIVCKKDGEWNREKLVFSTSWDYGVVELTDYKGTTLTMNVSDIKAVVEGFVDEDVLALIDEYNSY